MGLSFSKGQILGVASNEDVYKRGEGYYRQGNVLSMDFAESGGDTAVISEVKGNYKNYETVLMFDGHGRLYKYSCSCQSYGIWRGGCKHVVACLFAITEGNSASLVAAKHQRAARALVAEFEKQIYGEFDIDGQSAAEKLNNISLIPSLNIDVGDNDIYLTFSVGTNKKYLIKNIGEFIDNVRNEKIAAYGKKLSFRHSLDAFDDDSARLYRFVEKEYEYYMKITETANTGYSYYSAYRSKKYTRGLLLYGDRMDSFFDMYANKRLSAVFENESVDNVTIVPEKPDLKFRLDAKDNKLLLSSAKLNIRIIQGGLWDYVFINPNLYKVEKEYTKTVLPLFGACYSFDSLSLEISGPERNRFLSYALPKLKRLDLVEADIGPDAGINIAELKSRLYFDTSGNAVTCRVVFGYGETDVNAVGGKTAMTEDTGIIRDIAQERSLLRMISGCGFTADESRGEYVLSDDDSIYDLYRHSLEKLKAAAEVFVTDEFERKSLSRPPVKSYMGVRIAGNLLELSMDTSMFTLNELLDAIDSYNQKKNFHRLKDGRFISFEEDDINSAMGIMSSLDLNKKSISGDVIKLPKYRALFLDDISTDDPYVEKDENFQALAADFKRNNDIEFSPPESIKSVMRYYQLVGFNWLKILAHYGFGGILADDMGLGKTIQAIAVLLSEKDGQPSIVVAPTSVIYNWEQEIKKFAPSLNAVVLNGLPERRKKLLETPDTDIFITTYDMLKRDIDNYEQIKFKYIIADEAQNIKNPLTQNAQSVKALKGKTRLALTGTPMENALSELWSIFDFVMPGYLYTATKFSKLYESPIMKEDDKERAGLLRRQIAPFIMRRLKKDVLNELPEKTETTLFAQMHSEQLKIYTANLLKARGELEEFENEGALNRNRIRILAALTRLRQICCHPSLFMENYDGGSGKLELAMETITTAIESGHRILLFSQFTSMLSIIRNELEKNGISYFYLDGHTAAEDRNEMMNLFNKGLNSVFLISLKAGGTGLNLTGADIVIHYDPWWNPAVMDQASDRAHRYGQERAVQIYNIVAKDSIEEKIIELQSRKKDLIDTVITQGASFINKMSEDEVRELFM